MTRNYTGLEEELSRNRRGIEEGPETGLYRTVRGSEEEESRNSTGMKD
jgi:hypothetical protein